MQNTTTQAQALVWAAQQLQLVTDSANEHTYCLDTTDELIYVMQQLLVADDSYADIVASIHYSNDEVNESKYL